MKTKFSFLFLALISLCLHSCKDDSLPPAAPLFKTTATATIDGDEQEFYEFEARKSANNAFTVQGRADGVERVMLFCKEFSGEGTYISGGESLDIFAYKKEGLPWNIDNSFDSGGADEGVLHVTTYDESKSTISGTFEFTALNDDGGIVTITDGVFEDIYLETNSIEGLELSANEVTMTANNTIIYKDVCGPGSFVLKATEGASVCWIISPTEGHATLIYEGDVNADSRPLYWTNRELGSGLQLNSLISDNTVAGDFAVHGSALNLNGTFNSVSSEFDAANFDPETSLVLENFDPPIGSFNTDIDMSAAWTTFWDPNPRIEMYLLDACGNLFSIFIDQDVQAGDIVNTGGSNEISASGSLQTIEGELLWTGNGEGLVEILEHDTVSRRIVGELIHDFVGTDGIVSAHFDLIY